MAIKGLPPQTKRQMKDVVPLDTPYTVLISPTDFCNIKCEFCPYHGPAGKHAAVKSVMTLEYYKRIIDQLAEFPTKPCRLTFSGYGDPTCHKDLPEMIRYAKEKNVAEQIMLATNGILLNPEYNKRLIDSGLDYIRISVPAIDAETGYKITGHRLNVDSYINNIRNLFENKSDMIVLCKTTNVALGGEGGTDPDLVLTEKFYSMFDSVCDYMFVENIAPWAGTDEETVQKQGLSAIPDKDTNGRPRKMRRFCEFLFYMLTIDSVGNIRPCCLLEAPLMGTFGGEQSILDIWNSKHLFNLRLAHLDGKVAVCENCGVNSFIDTQNIDNDVEMIRQRMIGSSNSGVTV
jgi:MoaA/NifB/PqqE/SkfB family radical SAM enzyme